jgi:hypothetical protein
MDQLSIARSAGTQFRRSGCNCSPGELSDS